MTQKIWLVGTTGVGKDYLVKFYKKRYPNKKIHRAALADFLKKESLKEHKDWKYNGYLKEDFIKHHPNKDYNDYSKLKTKDKLSYVEIFKNMPGAKTRRALQDFGDYLKKKHNSKIILAKKLLEKLEKVKADLIIIPDVRFISEGSYLISKWVDLIKLSNPQLESYNKKTQSHLSEQEINLNNYIQFPNTINIDMMWKKKNELMLQYIESKDIIIKRRNMGPVLDDFDKALDVVKDEGFYNRDLNVDLVISKYKKISKPSWVNDPKALKNYQQQVARIFKEQVFK